MGGNYEFYWESTLLKENAATFTRPDMLLVDWTNKETAFIRVVIPLTHTLQVTITEKRSKYQEVAFEIKQQWQTNKTNAIPLVSSDVRVNPGILNQSLSTLNLPPRPLSLVQKVAVACV